MLLDTNSGTRRVEEIEEAMVGEGIKFQRIRRIRSRVIWSAPLKDSTMQKRLK